MERHHTITQQNNALRSAGTGSAPTGTTTVTKGSREWDAVFHGREPYIRKTCWAGGEPETLHFKGDPSVLFRADSRRIAVLGTRDTPPHMLEYTREAVRSIATACSEGRPPLIISGLAFGTDTAAHKAALDLGVPTVAVLPTGTDTVYPLANRDLAERMASTTGCGLVSFFPEKTQAEAWRFIERTKQLVLMCDAVVIVSSKERGTSILAARYAYDIGIPVYAIPGRPDDIHARGCNALICEQTARPFLTDRPITF